MKSSKSATGTNKSGSRKRTKDSGLVWFIKKIILSTEDAIKGKAQLSHVFWPWFLFFSLFEYVSFSLRQVIAVTPGGAIFGMVVLWLLVFAKPFWVFCVWRNARNVKQKVWGYLVIALTLLLAYYTYGKIRFFFMLISS